MTTISLKIGGNTRKSKFASIDRSVDWDKLPDTSKDFITRYGLKQWLQDGTVAATTQAEFNSKVDARIEKLKVGDLSRTVGEKGPTNDPNVLGAQLARTDVVEAAKERGIKLTKEQTDKAAASRFEKNKAKYVKQAEEQIAARKKRQEEAADEFDDLLSELGLDDGPEPDADDEPDDEANTTE